MANTVSILSYGNTFGELVTTQNALARENNALAANNYTKETGTLFLSDPDLGLQVANNAVVQGGLKVQGIGSYARVDNNLRVDGQIYFTNNTIGMTNFGQANVYGLLYANASGNSIISTNNVTVGGNTFITGNVYSANNLVISKNASIGGETTIQGTTNVANNLLVSQNTYVGSTVIGNRYIANTSTITPIAYVTGLLDAGLATSQLHVVTANNLTATTGYINNLQSNTSINASAITVSTLSANTLTTPTANIGTLLDANNASAFVKNLNISGEFSVSGDFTVLGETLYTANTFTLNSGVSSGVNGFYTVERGTGVNPAVLRWNETQSYWDLNDVATDQYYRLLTTQQINNTLVSTSTVQPASANVANTLYTLLNTANSYLQLAVANAGSFGNGAFSRANSAFDAANNVAPQIAPTYDRANNAYNRANTSANSIVGTSGTITPTDGSLSFRSNNGIVIAGSANNLFFNTPQDLRTSSSPLFTNLTLTNALAVTQGGTGAQSSAVALQNLLPSTVGVPSGYVLGTTGGLGASFNWVAGGSGGGGSTQTPGTRITTNRLSYTAAENQTDFTTPTYVTGSGQLRVYVNGVRQYTSDYTETSTTSVSMNSTLRSGDTVLIEVDGYYTWNNWANTATFTAPFGGIVSSANTIQLAIESVETRKAPLASPSFTGVPTSTKASMTTSNTWIATTNWVTEWANTGYTLGSSITGNAGTVTNGVYTNGSYSDPSWLTSLSKSKVGLSNVDNTADADKSVSYAVTAGSASSATDATNATYLGSTQQTNRITGASNSLAMEQNNTTALGSFVCRATGTGDSNLAGITYWNDNWALKQGVRADGYFGIGGWSSGAWRWYLAPGGDMTAAGNVTAYSDPRLKEDFEPIVNALDMVTQLEGGTFYWKSGFPHVENKAGKRDYGVLADQVEKIMPEIVHNSIEIDGESYKTVAYDKLVPLLIEAIKELKAEVEELKGKTK